MNLDAVIFLLTKIGMAKIRDLPLAELYAKPKITPSVEQAIKEKEDFTRIQPEYCEKVCRLNCKSYNNAALNLEPVDVLILQDHNAFDDRFKKAADIERTHRGLIEELCRRNLDGLKRRVANVVKCPITNADLSKGKPPTAVKQLKCSPYLLAEVRAANPKVIISLTNNASKAIGINKSNYTYRGEIYGNVILTLHPKILLMIRQNASGKMWGPDYFSVIDRDFNKAGRLARGELDILPLEEGVARAKQHILITRSLEDVRKAVEEILRLPSSRILSFDTETTGLDGWASDAKLLTIQFGYRLPSGQIRAIVIPLWHRDNKAYDPADAWNLIIPILTGPAPKIGHNVKFDVLYIYATTGVRVQNIVYDTMLVLHNINSGVQGNYGLKRAVWDWLPETGLGGYEDKLPKLTRIKEEDEDDDEAVETD